MISINKDILYDMLDTSCSFLEQEYEYINKLNVFPVPDGDTGSNMMTTLKGALDENRDYQQRSLYEFTKKFSRSLLMNAHGNSGVILSQILKGFFEPIKESTKEIDINLLIDSFILAKDVSYKVVDKPKEGTILTVIRLIAEELDKKRTEYTSIEQVFTDVITIGTEAVNKTPEMLDVLKKAKVVDSGAYGLMIIFKGMYDAITTKVDKKQARKYKKNEENKESNAKYDQFGINSEFVTNNEEGFGYCCEFILEIGAILEEDEETKKIQFNPTTLLDELNKIGNSIVFVYDDIFAKIHIHSLTPYKVLEIGQKFGEFHKIKIDNMTLQRNKNKGINTLKQTQDKQQKNTLSDETVLLATVPNAKIGELFKNNFNVINTIDRLNNQNPSVKDFINLINQANSKKNILVIDNPDCLLAANQAAMDVKEKNIEVSIINCSDIIQSIFAILNFNKYGNYQAIVKQMNKAIKKVISNKITIAAKNIISSKHLKISKGQYILVFDKKIINSNNNLLDICKQSIDLVIKKKKHNWNDSLYIIASNAISEEIKGQINEYVNHLGYEIEIIDGGENKYLLYVGA